MRGPSSSLGSQVPFLSPLEGNIYLRLDSEGHSSVQHQGFLVRGLRLLCIFAWFLSEGVDYNCTPWAFPQTMFEVVNGFGAWHRRFFTLEGSHMFYWNHPNDKEAKVRWIKAFIIFYDTYLCTYLYFLCFMSPKVTPSVSWQYFSFQPFCCVCPHNTQVPVFQLSAWVGAHAYEWPVGLGIRNTSSTSLLVSCLVACRQQRAPFLWPVCPACV